MSDSGLPPASGVAGGTAAGTGAGAPSSDCAAAGFEQSTNGLSGQALRDELTALTADHGCTDYLSATIFMFTRLDKDNDEVQCVYTGRTTPVTTAKPAEDDMNTEHSWPQSEGADTLPARCDLHHLYPADSDANATRASHPFGLAVSNISFDQGGSRLGRDASGTTVFEPRDAHKGNVARSMLYFSFRYQMPLSAGQVALFKDWNAQDPVDPTELDRTWQIATAQVLPNPLVVCPELADRL